MQKKELPVLSVVLYLVGALLTVFTVYYAYDRIKYVVDSIVSGGLEVKGNIFLIINHFTDTFGIYIIYTLGVFALAVILQNTATSAARRRYDEDDDSNGEISDGKETYTDEEIEEMLEKENNDSDKNAGSKK